MSNYKLIWYIKAARPQFFTGTIIPVSLGAVISYYSFKTFNFPLFLLTLFGALCIHAGLNLLNDYFDKKVDDITIPTPFSGGSRAIQNNLLKPKVVLIESVVFFVIGSMIGLYLNSILKGNIILYIGLIGMFLAVFYSAPPIALERSYLGEIAVGLGFGPVMVVGAYYVQSERIDWLPLLASIPIGILILLILYINEFPDYPFDKKEGKRNLVTLLGRKKASIGYALLMILTYIITVLEVIFKIMPPIALISLLPLMLVPSTISKCINFCEDTKKLIPVNATTILIHFLTGTLLTLSFLL